MASLRVAWAVGLGIVWVACSPTYDVVIDGGRVVDPESGLDALRNIGVLDGRISAISTERLEGTRVIDARGLVVAPGFVDLHRHGQTEEYYRLQVLDGVTTGLELETGPVDVAGWYAEREGGQLVNYGASVGHIAARAIAMGDSVTGIFGETTRLIASEEEVEETERLIREGLRQGALGVGFGTAYTVGASMAEIERMFVVAAEAEVPAFIHLRGVLPGLDSTLAAASRAGVPIHIVHANSSAGYSIGSFLGMIDSARVAGQDVTTEVYPYGAYQTSIQAAPFDDWESWDEEAFGNFQSAETGEFLERETFGEHRERGGAVIVHWGSDDLTLTGLVSPLTMVASDAVRGHPRTAGTFAKVLGRYVREDQALSLMDALGKMTIEPARRLEASVPAMRGKGRIALGGDADITIFDPAQVRDQATYLEPTLPSSGIHYVLVNGTVVVEEGVILGGVRPGRAVRVNR